MVHDKINLQNSVDIAAYYGAMKQAEMLNAIAHINYQIRQSWKLLTWRYRVLGSIGLTKVPLRLAHWARSHQPMEKDEEHFLPAYYHTCLHGSVSNNNCQGGFYQDNKRGPYFFCVGHQYWGGLIKPDGMQLLSDKDDDLLCAGMGDNIAPLQTANVGRVSSVLSQTFKRIQKGVKEVNKLTKNRCKIYGLNSWLLGALSFLHFYQDQNHRKKMIHTIATALKDGKDLDGNSIQAGVENTLTNNLSFINRQAVGPPMPSGTSLTYFSSLENELVANLLEDQPFYFTGFYSQFESNSKEPGGCDRNLNYVDNPHSMIRDLIPELTEPTLSHLKPENHKKWPTCVNEGICEPSAGMKKTDRVVVYYGVKAELEYKNQIFLPFSLTLRAKAFAKPFGGRIGPTNTQDPLLSKAKPPPRPPPSIHTDQRGIEEVDKSYSPNYSRYIGDELGLRSQLVHERWAEPVRGETNQTSHKEIKNYIKVDENDRDPMARGGSDRRVTSILARQWEIAAVAPDLFDVTYFTILPYYQYDYFPRLAKKILRGKPYLRGDLGTYCDSNCNNGAGFKGTSILTQTADAHLAQGKIKSVWQKLIINPQQFHPAPRPLKKKPAYKISSLNLLLTGWNPSKTKYPRNYIDIDNTYFGNCQGWVHDHLPPDRMSENQRNNTKGKIANGCIFGGRTGYSVKMLQRDYVCSEAQDFSPRPSPTEKWCP